MSFGRLGALGRGFGRLGGGGKTITINLSASTFPENSALNTVIGTLSVSGGTVTAFNDDWKNWEGKVASMIGQDLATVFGIGNLGITYQFIVGLQAGGASGGSIDPLWNDVLNSRSFVLNNSPPSGYAAAPASNYFSHATCASYIRPTAGVDQREIDFSTLFNGLMITGSITAGVLTVDSIATSIPSVPTLAVGMTIWGRGVGTPFSGVKIVSGSAPTWTLSSNITLTTDSFYLCSNLDAVVAYVDLINSGTSLFDLAGCYLIYQTWATFSRSFTNLNGATGKLCAYEGDYSPDYETFVSGLYQIDVLRYASKFVPRVADYTIANYVNFVKAGGEYPSNLQLAGVYPSNNVWAMFENIYQTPNPPQYDAHIRWNQFKRAISLRHRLHG